MIVNPHGTKFKLAGQTHCAPYIFREHRGSQTIQDIIAEMQSFSFIFKLLHCDHRAKHFLLHNLPILSNVADDSWLIVITLLKVFPHPTAANDLRTLGFRTINKSSDAFALYA